MIRLIEAHEHPPEPAYRVPWFVDRTGPDHVKLVNMSADTLRFVSTQFFGASGAAPAVPREDVPPGAALHLRWPAGPARDSHRATVHWFAPDDREYAWTFVC